MEKEFSGKTVLVTGSTSGIGEKLIIDFAKQGAQVIVNYRDKVVKARKVVEKLDKIKAKYVLVKGDISVYEQVERMKKSLKLKGISSIDVLVNNAGITRDKTLLKMTREEWDSVISVNLSGVFNATHVFLPLISKNGRIINISSIVGVRGNFGQTNYSASKAGLIGFTKSLAKEVGRDGITVNAVAPGFINTNMVKEIPEEYRSKIIKALAIPRLGEVEDISNAVRFLALESSGYITGHVLEITGGLSL
ncbi:MAG: 3-oxoacyl-ACP reductase FabG [Nanoarchaeota archaeon]|nr:3-oxoacyl-ACP reductase FabG [Nanoarchaeota archaeon]